MNTRVDPYVILTNIHGEDTTLEKIACDSERNRYTDIGMNYTDKETYYIVVIPKLSFNLYYEKYESLQEDDEVSHFVDQCRETFLRTYRKEGMIKYTKADVMKRDFAKFKKYYEFLEEKVFVPEIMYKIMTLRDITDLTMYFPKSEIIYEFELLGADTDKNAERLHYTILSYDNYFITSSTRTYYKSQHDDKYNFETTTVYDYELAESSPLDLGDYLNIQIFEKKDFEITDLFLRDFFKMPVANLPIGQCKKLFDTFHEKDSMDKFIKFIKNINA